MKRSACLTPCQEKARYELHQNAPENKAYVDFLLRALNPLIPNLDSEMRGLDYGSGPTPVASMILAEQGFKVENYDPFFAPRNFEEDEKFDFIICLETAEHFLNPAEEFSRIDQLLKPKGFLMLMTEVYSQETPFPQWRYLSDPTHVSLYQKKTLAWIKERYCWEMSAPHRNVRLFHKI